MQQPKYSSQARPDPIGQALHVTIHRTATDPPVEENAAVIALAATYGDAVEFEESNSPITAEAG
ncbi:hypothetical protein [Arthrobacter wenxiniae]|uniref:Uncharacterized protein n=1 Tax=Arthrobacter wenxiniae TaxID=2713570 RepID=A0A7Y7IEH5_9MICC|nr:hypothetical protein [Arthrobacter wenxiniae]NVM94019.1 hypothetical protein [Arthrobacter wenxiniae]